MTEHSDTPAQAGLQDLFTDAAEDFFPGTAPFDAIVGQARRRGRTRAVGGTALGVVAVGAAVTVGVGAFGGTTDGKGSAQTVAAAAGGAAAVAPAAAPTPTPALAANPPANEVHYGKTVIAQGDLDGTHWTLTRDLHLKGQIAYDDVYVTGPNGLRDQAGSGGSTSGPVAGLLGHSFGGADPAASISVTALGVGAMDNSWNKEKSSPYGIDFISGVVNSKVGKVEVVFADGTSQDAKLVAAPAGEDGQYFTLAFKSSTWHPSGHVVFRDSQGHILPSQISSF